MTVLNAEGLDHTLGGRHVLADVSFAVQPGELTVLMGANGAGKSTLLRICAGILAPQRGRVRIAGHDLAGGAIEGRRALSYVPDALTGFEHLSPRELTDLVLSLRSLRLPTTLPDLRAELGLDAVWSQPLRTLSFGQRRRASILAGLASEPAILMLDEPNSGLDPGGTEDLVRLLHHRRDRGGATLLATNDAELARALGCTLLRLRDGRVTAG